MMHMEVKPLVYTAEPAQAAPVPAVVSGAPDVLALEWLEPSAPPAPPAACPGVPAPGAAGTVPVAYPGAAATNATGPLPAACPGVPASSTAAPLPVAYPAPLPVAYPGAPASSAAGPLPMAHGWASPGVPASSAAGPLPMAHGVQSIATTWPSMPAERPEVPASGGQGLLLPMDQRVARDNYLRTISRMRSEFNEDDLVAFLDRDADTKENLSWLFFGWNSHTQSYESYDLMAYNFNADLKVAASRVLAALLTCPGIPESPQNQKVASAVLQSIVNGKLIYPLMICHCYMRRIRLVNFADPSEDCIAH